jgi:transposase-like protein
MACRCAVILAGLQASIAARPKMQRHSVPLGVALFIYRQTQNSAVLLKWTKPMSAANLARNSHSKHGRGTSKTAVFVAVERQGRIHRRVVTDVTAANLKKIMHEVIERRSRHMSDDFRLYWGVGKTFLTHETVNHSQGEYARGDVHTNTAESSFVLLKRGIHGIYHNVSRLHLQRYIWQADFLWNNRQLNDGERITRVIKSAEGKRVRYLPEQK